MRKKGEERKTACDHPVQERISPLARLFNRSCLVCLLTTCTRFDFCKLIVMTALKSGRHRHRAFEMSTTVELSQIFQAVQVIRSSPPSFIIITSPWKVMAIILLCQRNRSRSTATPIAEHMLAGLGIRVVWPRVLREGFCHKTSSASSQKISSLHRVFFLHLHLLRNLNQGAERFKT